jgi:methionyl-tRNA synthetase
MASPFYITTPIYYVNARPIWAMPIPPLQRMWSDGFTPCPATRPIFSPARTNMETKSSGQPSKEGPDAAGVRGSDQRAFQETVAGAEHFQRQFIRTTDPAHMAVVESILQRIYDAGDIYFSEYEGLYCFGCERFYTERELVDGCCPDHQTPRKPSRNPTTFSK